MCKTFINHFLPEIGIHTLGILPNQSIEEVKEAIEETGLADKLAMIYLETPANPNNALFDMSGLSNEVGEFYENKNEKEKRKKRKENPKEAAKTPQMKPPGGGRPISKTSHPLEGPLAASRAEGREQRKEGRVQKKQKTH